MQASNHKNPQKQKSSARDRTRATIEVELSKYKMTAQYLKLLDKTYTDQAQVDRANAWIMANKRELDPAKMYVCTDCDDGDDFRICSCHIKTVVNPAAPVDENAAFRGIALRKPVNWFQNDVYRLMGWQPPMYQPESVSNKHLYGFNNSYIPERFVDPKLFSYITVNMNASYPNSHGFDDRELRLEHCRRLALRYADQHNLDLTDLVVSGRIKHTVQRACDQSVNDMLYEKTDDISFWKAWSPTTFQGWFVLFLILLIISAALAHCGIWLSENTVPMLELVSDLLVFVMVKVMFSPIMQYMPDGSMQELLRLINTKNVVVAVMTLVILRKAIRFVRGYGHFKRR